MTRVLAKTLVTVLAVGLLSLTATAQTLTIGVRGGPDFRTLNTGR